MAVGGWRGWQDREMLALELSPRTWGCVPSPPQAWRRLSISRDGSIPYCLSLCQPGRAQAEILCLLPPLAGAVCRRWQGGLGGSWQKKQHFSGCQTLGAAWGDWGMPRNGAGGMGCKMHPSPGSWVGRGGQGEELPGEMMGEWEQQPELRRQWERKEKRLGGETNPSHVLKA